MQRRQCQRELLTCRHRADEYRNRAKIDMLMLQALLGLLVLPGIALVISEARSAVRWRTIVIALALQVVIAVILLRIPAVRTLFDLLNEAVLGLQQATLAGSGFVFGYLGGAATPFTIAAPEANFILAFQALPLIIVISALTAVLTYWRILPWLVRLFAVLLRRTLGIGGAVGLSTAANVFIGMVEAPLVIRPYLERLTRSELFIVMSTGMATISGTVLVLYATLLNDVIDNAVGHLLVASVMNVPAAIAMSLIMVPETAPGTAADWRPPPDARSTMDAITKGTQAGLQLCLQVAAMLLVLVALVYLVNAALGLLPDLAGTPVTLQRLLGYLMAPLCWCMGIPWPEAVQAGQLMGVKTVLTEFLAYLQLADLPADTLSDRSTLIMTYALCGFANFGSLGILLGGLTGLLPGRRDEIIALGLRTIVSGTLATCLTGTLIGLLSG